MEIILIAAMTRQRVIGMDKTIPWTIPGEQLRFKQTTMGFPLLMGRKTWQSIGKPLPGRANIVVTRNRDFQAPGAAVVHSLDKGIGAAGEAEKLFIIGGAQLYSIGLELADTLILTMLDLEDSGDTFFPEFSCPPYQLVHREAVSGSVPYSIESFQRRTS